MWKTRWPEEQRGQKDEMEKKHRLDQEQHYAQSSSDAPHRRGYRLTPQRYLILHVLETACGHLSVEQVLELVR